MDSLTCPAASEGWWETLKNLSNGGDTDLGGRTAAPSDIGFIESLPELKEGSGVSQLSSGIVALSGYVILINCCNERLSTHTIYYTWYKKLRLHQNYTNQANPDPVKSRV